MVINMLINSGESAKELLTHDNILIIAHMNPDGDTLGCAFALYFALKKMNKSVKIRCSDNLPVRFSYLYLGYEDEDFVEDFVVAVDVAAKQLFGDKLKNYTDKVDLAIDHHPSNELYAKKTFLNEKAAAACELVFEILTVLNAEFDKQLANCLYTGIATDSGCFKYSNTSPATHKIAAKLMEYGADFAEINRFLFDTKSKSRIAIEQQVLNNIEYFAHDKIALVCITQKMIEDSHADETELDGVSALPRMIEGVEVGITIRERATGEFKASLRTTSRLDASQICKAFGGGGHARAAGCVLTGEYEYVKMQLVAEIEKNM